MTVVEPMTSDDALPVRAAFRRGRPRFSDEAGEMLKDVLIDVAIPVPIPRRRAPRDDPGTQLPPRFVIELTADSVRVLGEDGATAVESWPRGAVTAYVESMDDREIEVALRWPDAHRAGRILADMTREARAVAELLAADTRVREGVDRRGDAELRGLVSRTLSEKRLIERQAAVGVLSRLLRDGERPLVVASAERGMGSGLVLLTDTRVLWASIGRRDAIVLRREQIDAAVCETLPGWTELTIRYGGEHDVRLGGIDPPEAAEAIAAATAPAPVPPAAPDAIDELLAAEPDDRAAIVIGKHRLDRVRELLLDGERPVAFAPAARGLKLGALVVTDRRVLWVARKGEPFVVARDDVRGAAVTRGRMGTTLELEFADAPGLRLDAIDPGERAELIVAALELPAA